jgi:hypothetical protein
MYRTLIRLAVVTAATAAFAFGVTAAEKKFKLKTRPYPLETCVISSEKLGEMGEPFALVEGNQEVLLCCKSCKKDFEKDKKTAMAKISEAWKKVKPYPLEVCIVSGEKLQSAEAVGVVSEGRELNFCCKDCVKDSRRTPQYVKRFDDAPSINLGLGCVALLGIPPAARVANLLHRPL